MTYEEKSVQNVQQQYVNVCKEITSAVVIVEVNHLDFQGS